MNKNDFKLILIVSLISILLIIVLKINNDEGNYALVYYENEVVKKIDLRINKKYVLKGYNGEVVLEVKSGKIKVIKEISPRHLCSKQGWVSSSLNPIICLPNKIIIKIEKEDVDVDTIVR